jgi:hypothetical protein
MIPDCIDSDLGNILRDIMKTSVAENVADCWNEYDFGSGLWEARLHWSGCPACRSEFAGVPAVFQQIGLGLENRCRDNLSSSKGDFLGQKDALLAAANNLPSAYPEIIARLAVAEEDVFPSLAHGQEVLCLRVSTDSPEQLEPSLALDRSLSSCREFICSLEPDVRQFVLASTLSHDLLKPVYEKIEAECTENDHDVFQQRMRIAIADSIADSGLQPDMLFHTIELAAIAYSTSYGGCDLNNASATIAQTHSSQSTLTLPEERIAIQRELEQWKGEWKRDFDSLQDSLKAGQTELERLIVRNSRPAAAFEPHIVAQVGAPLYSRLHETTQRAIQLAEYLYNINQEPDGFSLTAIRMAQGYENELTLRVIWPFVNELLTAKTQTYDAHGSSKEPLIRWGRVRPRGMTLGSLAWYLGKDPVMRSKVSGLGFDTDAISKDAAWVTEVRNEAAHDFACDRARADDLRRRILCRDGILSRLHPVVRTA